MPQRQTYPAIRGRVADEVGVLDLSAAEELTLILELQGGGGDIIGLPATDLDPDDPGSQFIHNGQTVGANWEAAIGSGLTDDVATFRAKLEIVWQAEPRLVQYAPKDGFIEIEVTENVPEVPTP